MPRFLALLLSAATAAAAPAPDDVLRSQDGRFRWKKGESRVTVHRPRTGKKRRTLRLPHLSDASVRRSVLFASRGQFFCVIDEHLSEIGLHLQARRGAKAARALVMSMTLHLVNEDGRTLWKKKLPDTHALDDPGEDRTPQIAADGTLAILLQDSDSAHVNPRPQLFVFSPKGAQRLKLDYIDWRRVDGYFLSPKGRYLAVRGFGLVEEDETWDQAFGLYDTRSKARRVVAESKNAPRDPLEYLNDDGGACCVRINGRDHSFDIKGRLTETE